MEFVRLSGLLGLLLLAAACNENNTSEEANKKAIASVAEAKIDGAISCSVLGFSKADSVTYMGQGGKDFKPTLENRYKPSYNVEGMVWIPGGEFSMGSVNPASMQDGGKGNHERCPSCTPYVNGFSADANEVTNASLQLL